VNLVSTLTGHGQRRAKLPTFGQLQTGGVVDVVRLEAFGVEQNLIPADDRQLVGG
jgi:hypothetical protein